MTAAARADAALRASWQRLAAMLLWLTLAWNIGEGLVAVAAGFAAGSVALVGFGLDGFIEVAAAAVMLWSLRAAEDERSERRERIAHSVIGVTFLALAAYVVAESAFVLAGGSAPRTSLPGLVLAAVSLAVMPVLGIAKRRNARRLGSRAMLAESTETLLCSYLSLALVSGLAANAAAGWWWADIAAALAMVPWIVREGVEGVRREDGE